MVIAHVKYDEVLEFKKRQYVRRMVSDAIRKGSLTRPKACDLCSGFEGGISAHHLDYGKPMDVMWLCRICHGIAHRKNSKLNPMQVTQTPLPACCFEGKIVTVTFTMPVRNFIAMKAQAEKKKKSISKIVRDEILKKFPVQSLQLEFNFEELKHDHNRDVKDQRVRSVAEDEASLPKPKPSILFPLRGERRESLSGMDGIFEFLKANGQNVGGMQRAATR
jgi:hypothetical protein